MARATLEVPLEDFQESKNIMIHSWPGQGKTIWGTGIENSTLIASEPGALSAKRFGRKVGLVRVHEWETALKVLRAVEAGEFSHREWLVIDTASTLQQKLQNSVLDKAVAENPRRDPDIPAIQDYQKQQNAFKRWVERMVDAPIDILWLCHTMRIEDRDGGVMYMPAITGGADKGYPISNYVMSLMNAVGYMEMRQVSKTVEGREKPVKSMVRRILWQPYHDVDKDARYTAKDHFDAFGRFTDDLDFPGHLAMIDEPVQEIKKPAVRRTRVATKQEEN